MRGLILSLFLVSMSSLASAQIEMVSEAVSAMLSDLKRRPTLLQGPTPVLVTLGMSALNLDMDAEGLVSAHVWLNMAWDDHRLMWDPSGFSNASKMTLPASSIWIPDIVLYNSHVGKSRLSSNGDADKSVVAFHDGSLTLFDDLLLQFRCDDYFNKTRSLSSANHMWEKFDCSIKFGSWSFNGNEVDLRVSTEGIDVSDLSVTSSLKILSSSTRRNEVYYSCCPEPYVDVTFSFVLQRNYAISEDGSIKWNPLDESV